MTNLNQGISEERQFRNNLELIEGLHHTEGGKEMTEKERLQTRLEELRDELVSAQEELSSLQKEKEEVGKKIAEGDSLEEQQWKILLDDDVEPNVERVELEVNNMETEISRAEAELEEIEDLRKQLDRAERENDSEQIGEKLELTLTMKERVENLEFYSSLLDRKYKKLAEDKLMNELFYDDSYKIGVAGAIFWVNLKGLERSGREIEQILREDKSYLIEREEELEKAREAFLDDIDHLEREMPQGYNRLRERLASLKIHWDRSNLEQECQFHLISIIYQAGRLGFYQMKSKEVEANTKKREELEGLCEEEVGFDKTDAKLRISIEGGKIISTKCPEGIYEVKGEKFKVGKYIGSF